MGEPLPSRIRGPLGSRHRLDQLYDATGQLTAKTENALSQAYVYDSVGNRTRLTDPDGKARTYTYDARGSVTSMVDVEGIWTTFQRDALGRQSTVVYQSGLQRLVSFTAGGRVAWTRDTTAAGSTVMQALTYTYDGAGNPTVVMDYSASPTTCTYDDASRLVGARRTRTNDYNKTYNYDAVGNTLYSGENATTFSYDAAGQIVTSVDSLGTSTFSYDLNGNLTTVQMSSGVTVAMLYDKENRLIRHDEGGTLTTFAYDGSGLKKVEQTATSRTTLVWDGADYLQARTGVNNTQYYTLEAQIIAQRDPTYAAGRVDYLLDALGSVLSGIHQTAGRPFNARYMPYGTKTSLFAGTIQDSQWVGSWGYRPTQRTNPGLSYAEQYVRARHYSNRTTAWTSVDPLWPGEMPFNYATRKPTSAFDATGLAGQGVGGAVGGCLIAGIGSYIGGLLTGDTQSEALCKAGLSCLLGAAVGFLLAEFPIAARCLASALGSASAKLLGPLCDERPSCEPPQPPNWPCILISALLGLAYCFAIPGLGNSLVELVMRVVAAMFGASVGSICSDITRGRRSGRYDFPPMIPTAAL